MDVLEPSADVSSASISTSCGYRHALEQLKQDTLTTSRSSKTILSSDRETLSRADFCDYSTADETADFWGGTKSETDAGTQSYRLKVPLPGLALNSGFQLNDARVYTGNE